MTDRTPNRGYSFPECDYPLVKDRADIGFVRDLAQQVNADAAALDADIVDLIEKPDAARVAFAGNITLVLSGGSSLEAIRTIPYDSTTYANPASMADLTANGLRIPVRGYYMFTSYVRCTNGGDANMQIRHLRNGEARTEGRRFEGPSFPVDTTTETSMATSDIFACNAGDLVRTQMKTHNNVGAFAFEARLSGILLFPLDA